MTNLEYLLEKYGASVGLEKLGLDKQGVCRIVFNNTYSIDIEPVPAQDIVHIYSKIGTAPQQKDTQFYEFIFEQFLFGKNTNFASICVDKESNSVYLWRVFTPSKFDDHSFSNLISGFVHTTRKLTRKLSAEITELSSKSQIVGQDQAEGDPSFSQFNNMVKV